jgi:hypothetical protein
MLQTIIPPPILGSFEHEFCLVEVVETVEVLSLLLGGSLLYDDALIRSIFVDAISSVQPGIRQKSLYSH